MSVVFGVSGGMRSELSKGAQIVHRQRVAGQMKQRIQQHRAVAVRHHEAIAIWPERIGRVVLEVIVPEHFGDIRHAHRHARMTGIRLLYRIHREGPDCIGKLPAVRCRH